MSNMKVTQQVINVKRRLIHLTKEQKEFIFHNINYRRKVWNDFVEESHNYDSIWEFSEIAYEKTYLKEYDKYEKDNPLYCVGIPEQVMKNMMTAKQTMKGNKRFQDVFTFRSFDRYYGAFSVNAKAMYAKGKYPNSRIIIQSENKLKFRANRNSYISFTLKEPLYTDHHKDIYYMKDLSMAFQWLDIKTITFIHHLGKFYIQLGINMNFFQYEKHPLKKAGLDMGIHNPITLRDKNGFYTISMSQKQLNRIHYLERRASKLKSIMDKKYKRNKERGLNPYSKNYEKVRRKYRITWRKIYNIRDNWKKNICKDIATTYRKIVVDNYKIPDHKDDESLPREKIRFFNSYNRLHAMSYLMEYLPYACVKYGCEYIKAPQDTTRTCCLCGHVNPHIPLSQRTLICEKCHTHIDRDKNASQNCYDFA